MKKLFLATFFALPVLAQEAEKQEAIKKEQIAVKVEPVQVQVVGNVNVNVKRPFRTTIGIFARTSFGKSVITLPDENSYRMSDYADDAGITLLAYEINREVLRKAYTANTQKKPNNGKDYWDSCNTSWQKMDIEGAKKSLENLGPERAFTGGIFLESLSNTDSPLKIGFSCSYAYKSEFSYRFILGYQYQDYFIKIGYSLEMAGVQYDGKYKGEHVQFKKDGFGSALHFGVDYKLNEHIDVFGEYSYADIGLLNYHRLSVGLKHYIY